MYLGTPEQTARVSVAHKRGKVNLGGSDKRRSPEGSTARDTPFLSDRSTSDSQKTADQRISTSLPGESSLLPSRDFFFGPSRRPPKRGPNRAYYDPILPPDELVDPLFVFKPHSAPVERITSSHPLPTVSRSSSWSPPPDRRTRSGGVPDQVTKWREAFARGQSSSGQGPSSPPERQATGVSSAWSAARTVSGVSIAGNDSVNGPATFVDRGVQAGLPAEVPTSPQSESALSMQFSPAQHMRGTVPEAVALREFDTNREAASPSSQSQCKMVSNEDGPSRAGDEVEDFHDTHPELETSISDVDVSGGPKGRLPWGPESPQARILNSFGVQIRDIIELAERTDLARKHLGGSEIAPQADNEQSLADGGSPHVGNPDKALDFALLRAEHRRLASLPGTPSGGDTLSALRTPASEPATPSDRNDSQGGAYGEDEKRGLDETEGVEGSESRGREGQTESAAMAESVPESEARLPGAGTAEALVDYERQREGQVAPEPANLLEEESNGDSSSRYFVNSPQRDDEEGPEATSDRQLASRENHLVYDFAYEARQRQMEAEISDLDQMKERFSKLLLGEDMSGGGKGVSTALAISNALTNLSAAVFGELHKLEPLAPERKRKWKRELEWLLCPADHIVEMVPSVNKSAKGPSHEVMVLRQRADLHASLPALRKLDTMLTECLDSFAEKGFWYVDPGHSSGEFQGGTTPHQSDRWWLPEAMVPAQGLDERSMRKLANQKGVAKQILKAAMAINAQVLSEMAVPDAYWETLPKSSRAALGDGRYRLLTGDSFSPDMLLSTVKLSDEHSALKCANDLEAAIHIWRRKTGKKAGDQDRDKFGNGYSPGHEGTTRFKNALSNVMGPMLEKREKHASRAMDALWNLRLRCPGLSQTTLHVYKIQYNKDVGQAILESYSRVLESLASNILNRIEHVLAVNAAAREQLSFARGPVSGSTPATPSSLHSSIDGSFTPTGDALFSGSQTPTSPLKEEPPMYTGKTVPVLSSVKRPASQGSMRRSVGDVGGSQRA